MVARSAKINGSRKNTEKWKPGLQQSMVQGIDGKKNGGQVNKRKKKRRKNYSQANNQLVKKRKINFYRKFKVSIVY